MTCSEMECLTYKYSLIAVILVPIICTLSMSLLVPLASVPTTINNSVRFSVELLSNFRTSFIISYYYSCIIIIIQQELDRNCTTAKRELKRRRNTAGRATKETWTESILFIFILFFFLSRFVPYLKNFSIFRFLKFQYRYRCSLNRSTGPWSVKR